MEGIPYLIGFIEGRYWGFGMPFDINIRVKIFGYRGCLIKRLNPDILIFRLILGENFQYLVSVIKIGFNCGNKAEFEDYFLETLLIYKQI